MHDPKCIFLWYCIWLRFLPLGNVSKAAEGKNAMHHKKTNTQFHKLIFEKTLTKTTFASAVTERFANPHSLVALYKLVSTSKQQHLLRHLKGNLETLCHNVKYSV